MYIKLNGLEGYLNEYNDLDTITKDINNLNIAIKNLNAQREQMLIKYNSIYGLEIRCPKCNGTNLFIQKKSKNNVNLIGLYCKTCKNEGKRTGYIKFISQKEYNNLKWRIKEIDGGTNDDKKVN